METRYAMLAIAMLAILGGALFAVEGTSGTNAAAATAAGTAAPSARQEMPDSDKIAMMKAMHEGDYASAKALAEKYGVPVGSEEIFSLRYQMREKMDGGDYEGALELQKQIREIGQERMQEMRTEMQALREKYGMGGMGAGRMGGVHRMGGMQGGMVPLEGGMPPAGPSE